MRALSPLCTSATKPGHRRLHRSSQLRHLVRRRRKSPASCCCQEHPNRAGTAYRSSRPVSPASPPPPRSPARIPRVPSPRGRRRDTARGPSPSSCRAVARTPRARPWQRRAICSGRRAQRWPVAFVARFPPAHSCRNRGRRRFIPDDRTADPAYRASIRCEGVSGCAASRASRAMISARWSTCRTLLPVGKLSAGLRRRPARRSARRVRGSSRTGSPRRTARSCSRAEMHRGPPSRTARRGADISAATASGTAAVRPIHRGR